MTKYIYDRRRLCRESHVFLTRKGGKTQIAAGVATAEAHLLGELNAQVLICCNSLDQAKICFGEAKKFAYQLDPKTLNRRGSGKYLNVTAKSIAWKSGQDRTAEIIPMSAGGKTKDGLYGSLVIADEHGSASYVKGHSDMESLVQVCVGSMGPRREPMILHTTTAGLVNEGPYQLALRTVEEQLLEEMNYPLGQPCRTVHDDYFALLLRLDPWEITDTVEDLNHPNLWRKVNRSIGVTVQPDWYPSRIKKAMENEDSKREVLTKDFNIWQTDNHEDWLTPEQIRALQVDFTIDQCSRANGWLVAVGDDYSMGDDLFAQSYLAWRINPQTGKEEFFADMDAWCTKKAVESSTAQTLFEQFAQNGHLHIVEGETVDASVAVNRLAELYNEGIFFIGIGYDPYQAKGPVNMIKTWVYSIGGNPIEAVLPVRQNFATYNPVVGQMDYMVKADEPLIHFSMNPMWLYEFGSCLLAISNDGNENKKPVKRTKDGKVDNVQALLSALSIMNLFESKMH